MASDVPQESPKECPISTSIAIEFTSKSVSAFYNNKIIEGENLDHIFEFKNSSDTSEAFENVLKKLRFPEGFTNDLPVYWTIGIPDNTSQKNRKAVIEAVENFVKKINANPTKRDSLVPGTPDEDKPRQLEENLKQSEKKKPKEISIRLINRSTAGAIAYMQSKRDEERRKALEEDEDGDVDPVVPNRNFLVLLIDNEDVYGAAFETQNGLVQQRKSYVFKRGVTIEDPKMKDSDAEKLIERVKSSEGVFGEIKNKRALHKLKIILKDEDFNIPIVFTHETTTCIIHEKMSEAEKVTEDFVTSPLDKFALFPSINGVEQIWPNPERFILKGINTKTRMLAGDADMIDYDVPSGFIGDATIMCDKFKASLIIDGEQLPIKRTIFETTNPLKATFDYGFYESKPLTRELTTFTIEVNNNGIIKDI